MEKNPTMGHGSMVSENTFSRARIFKLVRTPGINSTESIPCEKSIPDREIDSRQGGVEEPRKKRVYSLPIGIEKVLKGVSSAKITVLVTKNLLITALSSLVDDKSDLCY
jgi:hypothetical protein